MNAKDFPHLVKLQEEINALTYGTAEYWKQRCTMLEKYVDPTYSDFERNNCRNMYITLVNKPQVALPIADMIFDDNDRANYYENKIDSLNRIIEGLHGEISELQKPDIAGKEGQKEAAMIVGQKGLHTIDGIRVAFDSNEIRRDILTLLELNNHHMQLPIHYTYEIVSHDDGKVAKIIMKTYQSLPSNEKQQLIKPQNHDRTNPEIVGNRSAEPYCIRIAFY